MTDNTHQLLTEPLVLRSIVPEEEEEEEEEEKESSVQSPSPEENSSNYRHLKKTSTHLNSTIMIKD